MISTRFENNLSQRADVSGIQYQEFVDAVPIGLYGMDTNGACVYVNQEACALLDVTFAEALGYGWSDRIHPEDKERVMISWGHACKRREFWQAEYRLIHRDGRIVWVLARCVFKFSECGSGFGAVGSLTDITSQKEMEATLGDINLSLQCLVNLDGLTGVPNRRYFDERFVSEWFRMLRAGQNLSVMMIDIDYFKAYNDTYGHVFGDKVLKLVAQAVKQTIEQQTKGILARYGGEEFAAIFPETSASTVETVAQSMVAAVQALEIHHQSSQVSDYLTISVGVHTVFPTATLTPECTLREADIALYVTKEGGRNRVVVYSEEIATAENLANP